MEEDEKKDSRDTQKAPEFDFGCSSGVIATKEDVSTIREVLRRDAAKTKEK